MDASINPTTTARRPGEPQTRRDLSARATELGWNRPQTGRNLLHAAAATAVLGSLGWLSYASSWAVRALTWPVMAYGLLSLVAFSHEAVHSQLFRSRLANLAAGRIAGLVLVIPIDSYHALHLEHHVHTGQAKDPEGEPLQITSRWLFLLFPIGIVIFSGSLWLGAIRSAIGKPPSWVRSQAQCRAIRRGLALHGIVYTALVMVVPAPMLALAWIAPVLLAYLTTVPFILGPEHLNAPPGTTTGRVDQLQVTRGIRSNALTRLVYRNHNFHHAHHHLPAVTSRYLGEISSAITLAVPADMYAESYVAFYRRVWREAGK
jgi:fatty acid desaturase